MSHRRYGVEAGLAYLDEVVRVRKSAQITGLAIALLAVVMLFVA